MFAPEDFTFPVISTDTNTNTNAAVIPPLWRISDSDQRSTAARQRRTFGSQITTVDGRGSELAEAESQEKMDLLWEDFNEHLQSSLDSSDSETSQHHDNNNANCSSDEFQECANVRQFRAKPKKLGSLVKVMKKLFSVKTN